ncbi:MAG: oligoribonuclease [Methylophilaceae bacterium]
MTKNNNNLVWLDMEMTGLDPVNDKIIEIAVIVTDPNLEILSEAPVFVIKQDDSLLQNMDAWNTNTHSKSGLIEKVKHSTTTEKDAEDQLINFLKPYVDKNKSPMCGNTICQDRRFMANYMPKLEAYFHYRNLDVSVFKELAKRWRPELIGKFKKSAKHEALADIKESIEELKFYREHFLKIPND